MDPEQLWATLSWQLLAVCVVTLVLGGAGGLVHLMASDEAPAPDPRSKRTAAISRFLVGAIAAVATLYLTQPSTGVAFVGGALAAGYAGQAVMAGLEARVKATLSAQDAAQTRADLREVIDQHETIVGGTRDSGKDTAVAAAVQRIAEIKTHYRAGAGR